MAVKAQVTAAPVPCPRPGTPGVGGAGRPGIASFRPAGGWGATAAGTGRSPGAGPGIASRPDPVAGIGWDTGARTSGGALVTEHGAATPHAA